MDVSERLVAIRNRIIAIIVMVVYAAVCWQLGVRDIKLMLIVFFAGIFVFAFVYTFITERLKKRKAKTT